MGMMPDHLEAEQAEIIEKGKAHDAYLFADTIPDADIKALQQVVIQHGSAVLMSDFARSVEGADIPALQAGVLAGDEPEAIYRFGLCSAPGTDVTALQKRMIEIGDPQGLYEFARDVSGADRRAIADHLREMKDGQIEYRMLMRDLDDSLMAGKTSAAPSM